MRNGIIDEIVFRNHEMTHIQLNDPSIRGNKFWSDFTVKTLSEKPCLSPSRLTRTSNVLRQSFQTSRPFKLSPAQNKCQWWHRKLFQGESGNFIFIFRGWSSGEGGGRGHRRVGNGTVSVAITLSPPGSCNLSPPRASVSYVEEVQW